MFNFAEFLTYVSAASLFYVYIGYPTLIAALATFVRRRRPAPGSDDDLPTVSVLIAAYNEEKSIGRKIQQTLALSYPAEKLEIVVVSDASTDGTDSIVSAFRDPRVRLLRMSQRRGKTHAQNQGIKICRGEIVAFSDATTVYHPQALRFLACNYQNASVGAASGRYQYFDPSGDSPTGLGTIAFWNYENQIKTLQSRIKTITGCCGCIYSVRRNLYTELPDDIISDLVQPLWIIQKGYRVAFEDRALAYEETTKSANAEFAMRVRIITRGIRGLLSVPNLLKPWKHGWVSFQLFSHKVLRWMVPFFLIILLAGSALLVRHPGFRYLVYLQGLFYLSALVSGWVPIHRRWRPLGVPLYFCTLNAAALFSVIEVLRGKKYIVWETARSRG